MSKLLKDVFKKKRAKDLYVPTRAKVSRAPTMDIGRVPQTVMQKSIAKQRKGVKKQFKVPSQKDVKQMIDSITKKKDNDVKLPETLRKFVQKENQKQKNLDFIYQRMDKNKLFDINEFERVRSENGMDNRAAPTQNFLNDIENAVDDVVMNREIRKVGRRCAAVLKQQFPKKKMSEILTDNAFNKVEFRKFIIREMGFNENAHEQMVAELSYTADVLSVSDDIKNFMEKCGFYEAQSLQPVDVDQTNNAILDVRTRRNWAYKAPGVLHIVLFVLFFSVLLVMDEQIVKPESEVKAEVYELVTTNNNREVKKFEVTNSKQDPNPRIVKMIIEKHDDGHTNKEMIVQQVFSKFGDDEVQKSIMKEVQFELSGLKYKGGTDKSTINGAFTLSTDTINEYGKELFTKKPDELKNFKVVKGGKETTIETNKQTIIDAFKGKYITLFKKYFEKTSSDVLKDTNPLKAIMFGSLNFDQKEQTKMAYSNSLWGWQTLKNVLAISDDLFYDMNFADQTRRNELSSVSGLPNRTFLYGQDMLFTFDITPKEQTIMRQTVNGFTNLLRFFFPGLFAIAKAKPIVKYILGSGVGIFHVGLWLKNFIKNDNNKDTHKSWQNINKQLYRTATYVLKYESEKYEPFKLKTRSNINPYNDDDLEQEGYESYNCAPFSFVKDTSNNYGRVLPSVDYMDYNVCILFDKRFKIKHCVTSSDFGKLPGDNTTSWLLSLFYKLSVMSNMVFSLASWENLFALIFCYSGNKWTKIREVEPPNSEVDIMNPIMFFSGTKGLKNVFTESSNIAEGGYKWVKDNNIKPELEDKLNNNLRTFINRHKSELYNGVLRYFIPLLKALQQIKKISITKIVEGVRTKIEIEIKIVVCATEAERVENNADCVGFNLIFDHPFVDDRDKIFAATLKALRKLHYVESKIIINKVNSLDNLGTEGNSDTSLKTCMSIFTRQTLRTSSYCHMFFNASVAANNFQNNNLLREGQFDEDNNNFVSTIKSILDIACNCYINKDDIRENNVVQIMYKDINGNFITQEEESDFVYNNGYAACVIGHSNSGTSTQLEIFGNQGLENIVIFGIMMAGNYYVRTQLQSITQAVPGKSTESKKLQYGTTLQEILENFTPDTAGQYTNILVLSTADLDNLRRYFASLEDNVIETHLETMQSLLLGNQNSELEKIVTLLEAQKESQTIQPFSGPLPEICEKFKTAIYCVQNMSPYEVKYLSQLPKAFREIKKYLEKNGGMQRVLDSLDISNIDIPEPASGLQFNILLSDDEIVRDNIEKSMFTVSASPGDGLCLFHSVGQGVNADALQLKEMVISALREVDVYETFDVSEEKRKLESSDITNAENYPGEISVRVLADELNITIKVYVRLDNSQYIRTYNEESTGQVVHILNRRNTHYDFLKPINTSDRQRVENEIDLTKTRVIF